VRDYTKGFTEDFRASANGKPPQAVKEAPKPSKVREIQSIYFQGRKSYAIARVEGGVLSYYPVEGTPSDAQIYQHLEGEIALGSYTLLPDSTVTTLVFDVDAKPFTPANREKARNITKDLSDRLGDLPHAVEFSGGKGYHIIVYFDEPVPANVVREKGQSLRELMGVPSDGTPHMEVFPKQDKLTDRSPMGNLVKLPLGVHPGTKARSEFVDPSTWEPLTDTQVREKLAAKVTFEQFKKAMESILAGPEGTVIDRLVLLLGSYWVEGERHNMALAVSGFLGKLGWASDDVEELVTRLTEAYGGEINNLLECVEDTFKKLADNKEVQGFTHLNEKLPSTTMRSLCDLAGQNIADPIIQLIDRIRLEKKVPPFLKVRQVALAIFSDLQSRGRFIKAQTGGTQYWFEFESKRLWNCEGDQNDDWEAMTFHRYRINRSESFCKQVRDEIMLTVANNTEILPIYSRFHWDTTALWVSFEGKEVYKLDGKGVELHMNGEDNLIFYTSPDGMDQVMRDMNLLEVEKLDTWELLTSHQNFERKDGVTNAEAAEQEQMLRAYILSICFPELHRTKPIKLTLGPRGSGKTTADRMLVRFFQGLRSDVLNLAEDKPDGLRASVEGPLVMSLDNMESSQAKWIAGFLDSLATGAEIKLRTLYKTNHNTVIRPTCFPMVTAIELPKNLAQEAFVSRVLPLQLENLTSPISESFLQEKLERGIVGAWAGMLPILNMCVASLKAHENDRSKGETHRLADFQNFCRRLRDLPPEILDYNLLRKGFESLTERQESNLVATSAFVQAVELWLDWTSQQLVIVDDPATPRTLAELLPILRKAAEKKIQWPERWTSAQKVSGHVRIVEPHLRSLFGCVVTEGKDDKGREAKWYSFPGLS